MLYRTFGKTGWPVSAIGSGNLEYRQPMGRDQSRISPGPPFAAAFEHGVNLFDTAESYGMPNGLSEERLGTALAGIRHRVIVVSKIGNWGKRTGQGVPKTTVDMIRLCGHAILHRLQTDWLDVVLCHEADIEDPPSTLKASRHSQQEGAFAPTAFPPTAWMCSNGLTFTAHAVSYRSTTLFSTARRRGTSCHIARKTTLA